MLESAAYPVLATYLGAGAFSVVVFRQFLRTFMRKSTNDHPPTVHVPADILISDKGHEVYARVLADHGPVVVVPRHGIREYVIDHRHCERILTDSKRFTFDQAVVKMLHMEFVMWFKNGTFVTELEDCVIRGVQNRLDPVLVHVLPRIRQSVQDIIEDTQVDGEKVEITNPFETIQRIIARAMTMLILGPRHCNDAMTKHFIDITVATSHLSGMYENTNSYRWAPRFFQIKTALQALLFTIAPVFLFRIVPELWQTLIIPSSKPPRTQFVPVFDVLVARHCSPSEGIFSRIGNFIWAATISLGLIFASVHQTAVVTVWVIVQLISKQDEYLGPIREEWESVIGDASQGGELTTATLNRLTKLDSFIREVMRLKSDTFSPLRVATEDVQIAGCTIPKGALCTPYVKQVHEHVDNYGPDSLEFKGFQWHEESRPCVQTSSSFLSFGMGRWACPGRHLAVNEMKAIIYLLFSACDVSLKGNRFKVVDPMNTTSVPPEATLILERRKTVA